MRRRRGRGAWSRGRPPSRHADHRRWPDLHFAPGRPRRPHPRRPPHRRLRPPPAALTVLGARPIAERGTIGGDRVHPVIGAGKRGGSAMYAVPDVDEIVAVARSLGIHLGADEAVLYHKHLLEQLDEADAFVQARIAEPAPPMLSPARKPPRRPTAEEDPLNAWMWKCSIEGEAEGLLAGKTVSFKDHIAIAGIP